MSIHKKFIDECFQVHLKGMLLGQGGQGVVFRTNDPDIAIKLVTDNEGNPVSDPIRIKKLTERLKKVRRLPLPSNLNLSTPVTLLKGTVGYVMQLLSDMIPFSSFWVDEKKQNFIIPEWLEGIPKDSANKIIHYYKTGGLRRRLVALYKSAATLARLHGNGFVYGDISPNNVFISEDLLQSEVWFIDADNLRFEIASGGSAVYTPKFGAPELVQELDGGRPRSDCHAFAVMAFYLLSLIHPFIGELVEGGGDADWADDDFDDEDIEEKAYAGHISWIDDINDDSNSTTSGLPRLLVLTKKLEDLFQKTFGDGRTQFWKRPSIYHWPEALAEAADKTILCPSCTMSWFFDLDGDICPYCHTTKPRMFLFQSYQWTGEKELSSPCWTYTHEIPTANLSLTLNERLFKPFSITSSDNLILKIVLNEQHIFITKSETCNLDIFVALSSENAGNFERCISQIQLPISAINTGFWLYAEGDEPRLVKCIIMEKSK